MSQQEKFVFIEIEGVLALVTIDNPPVNALSAPVRRALYEAIAKIEAVPDVRGAILLCAGKTFVTGADIKEFGKPLEKPIMPDLIAALESSTKIWAAAMHGTVLGGGLELVLGCAYRIAQADTQFGLPEVTLGIIPGAGGTQRLPRLVGLEAALDIVTSGKRIDAKEAVKIGLIDRCIDGNLKNAALDFLSERLSAPRRAISRAPIADYDRISVEKKQAQILRQARGQLSPVEAANAVMLTTRLPLDEGLRQERAIFEKLAASEQSRALRYQFFAERGVAKIPELEGVVPCKFERIGIVGAGTMGCGIAASCLLAGLDVILTEKDAAAREKGKARLDEILSEAVKRGRLAQSAFQNMAKKKIISEDLQTLSACDLVIEAVFEDSAVKKNVLARLGAVLPPDAIIATNTSYLDIDELAQASGRPENFLGLHFFSPAHVMKLLEIVRGAKTAPDVLATGVALAKRLKKIGVLSGNAEGFIGNRIWQCYRREIEYMIEEGASPCDIDAAMEAYGFGLGPFKVADLSGLDIAWAQRKRRAAARPADERYVEIPDLLCEAGRLGKKTNAGWYAYEDGKPVPDSAVGAIIASERERKKIPQHTFTQQEIQQRVLGVIIEEARKLLEEGIAQRPPDIDVVMVTGYGYPRWRGGPLFEAETPETRSKETGRKAGLSEGLI